MRHRPSERKAVVALLEQEWEDVEALATALLDRLLEVKWARGGWVLVARTPWSGADPTYAAFGPYDTERQALRDLGARVVAAHPGVKAMPLRVVNLDALADNPQLW